ncbi:hypothetical protein C8Q77DRAFT_1054760 [Trametes polyzona]|nr:hypothetical protein C8Q77DRAFT_1054760 [Trametes polyzona]
MPASSASTSRPTIFGLFDRPATPELDIEAQLPNLPPAHTHSARANASIEETRSDPVDDFFGAPRSSSSRRTLSLSGTRDSRHDDARSSTLIDVEDVPPPPYECSVEPPVYTSVSDQPTLAMYLFKFGFLFPLFWVAGAFILLSPLQAPSDWEATKPEYERQELIESTRRAEVKWAKRCLVMLATATFAIAGIAVTTVFVLRS